MRIGLIDADLIDNGTRHPNLALMKLSAYHKEIGDEVSLLLDYKDIENYDQVIVSKVFTFTKNPDLSEYKNVILGGTGFFPKDGGENLKDEIEHHMPDYSLYNDYINREIQSGKKKSKFKDYLDYSIGFTTRGCFRKCEFCVNKKYDRVQSHSPVKEFLNKDRKGIYLWDDNFLAFQGWEKVLDELEETGKSFQFRQGLDVRLMTEKIAERFSKVKYNGDYIFAFDHLKDKTKIERGLKIWKKHVKKATKLYVLSAYESQDIEDIKSVFERIKILMKYGCLPYIMRYEDYLESELKDMYIQIARWCNQPSFLKKKSFREFCIANQEYHKTPNTNCKSYQTMIDFQEKYPEVAQKYFDMKFENLNRYKKSEGNYERNKK